MTKKSIWSLIVILLLIGGLAFLQNKSQPRESVSQEAIDELTNGANQNENLDSDQSQTQEGGLSEQSASTQQLNQNSTNNSENNSSQKMNTATIQTNKGTISIEFFPEDAPKTVENFATLANKGFYDGVIFHRVIEGFMIQGGDPTGTGTGGPGYKFEDELNSNTESYKRGYLRGTVAMANAGPNTNGSQFFIMHKDYPLPHNYTIFGRVTSGMEVVDAIAESETDGADKPLEEIKMQKVTVE